MLKVYSKDACPQCSTVVEMLRLKGIEHIVLKLGVDYQREELLKLAPSARTLPQVTEMDGTLIGGLTEIRQYLVSV